MLGLTSNRRVFSVMKRLLTINWGMMLRTFKRTQLIPRPIATRLEAVQRCHDHHVICTGAVLVAASGNKAHITSVPAMVALDKIPLALEDRWVGTVEAKAVVCVRVTVIIVVKVTPSGSCRPGRKPECLRRRESGEGTRKLHGGDR